MKRDMNLIRDILLYTEMEAPPVGVKFIDYEKIRKNFCEYEIHDLLGNFKLCAEAGLINKGQKGVLTHSGLLLQTLTWEGHDFLEKIRDDAIWRATQSTAEEVGSFSIDILKSIAQCYIKKKIEDMTGFTL